MRQKNIVRISLIAALCAGITSIPFAKAEDNSAADVANEVGSAVGGTFRALGKTLTDTTDSLFNPKEAAQVRKEIDQKADATMKRLLSKSAVARALKSRSYGYAVFDTRKFSFAITTGFGAGVVVEPDSAKRTYMKMATGGATLGGGVQYFQLIFLFENKSSLERFITDGWEANAAASGVFGKNALEENARFVEGMAAFQMNETGIMADLNITGTKYWRSDDLNKTS